jgi:cell division protein FtsI/penicillin-binding protein 2
LPKENVLARIQEADRTWTLLTPRVPANAAARVESEALPGVELQRLPARAYPEGSTAAQVLGFVGAEGRGLSGLELTLDQELAGKPGVVLTERDTTGGEITIARKAIVPEVPGADIVLTVDRYIQHVAERELARAVQANKATGGVIIVMEPSTGAILGAATSPTYNLDGSGYDPAHPELFKPSIATDTYEPGSVMKLITAAAAVEEGVVNPDTRYFDSGVALVNGVPIRNWDGGAYGSVTLRQILVYSLNTGAQWVAGQLGPERFYDYVHAFGFGEPTGVRLNGEASGSFRRPSEQGWSRIDLATNSYGQSISVTPLQMIAAVAALGNGGVLMRPHLVREIRGADATQIVEPEPVRQVVSSRTAETMLDMMVSAWSQPALAANRIEGYTLAAKSGTADIPGPGGYSSGKTYASYIGFAPIPNPRFVVLVRLDRPEAIYGGAVAAPVFRNVVTELLTYFQVPPRVSR